MRNVYTWRILASLFLAAGAIALARDAAALDPPRPDFFWPYGVVQGDGANLNPTVQPVLAFISGSVCGSATTRVAEAGPDTPPADAGKTVYVVDVLADGPGAGERPGCGHTGDPVTLYFPASGRVASFHPTFQAGGLRVDLQLTQMLSNRLTAAQVTSEGVP